MYMQTDGGLEKTKPKTFGKEVRTMDLRVGDIVETKKSHPCGANLWELTPVGMDVKMKCKGCGHEVMVPRGKAEKSIKKILPRP
jgi:hypothetical protein